MTTQEEKLRELGQLMNEHGFDFVSGLIVLIAGLYIIKWITGKLKYYLGKMITNNVTVSILSNITGIILLFIVLLASSIQIGANPRNVMAFLMIISLLATGLIILFRALIPDLPFRVGNTVKFGNLLGKVEATIGLFYCHKYGPRLPEPTTEMTTIERPTNTLKLWG